MAWPSRLTSGGTTGARRRRVLGVMVGLVALVAVTACGSSGPVAQWGQPGGGPAGPAEPAAILTFSHEKDAAGVSPGQPVSVQVIDGTLDTVTLTTDGGEVKGEFQNDHAMWRTTQNLDYSKTYTLTVKGTGQDGKAVEDTRSFSTVRPGNYSAVYLQANPSMILNGGTFGVGQPIVAHFDEPIPDKAAAERALTVTTTPAVEGSWSWVSDRELHWRPQNYWAPGTKVTVDANILGVALGTDSRGNSLYGQENNSASFTIGPSRIAIADSATHHMKVYIDGTQVTTINGLDISAGIPISTGMNGAYDKNHNWIDLRTHSGPHVVMEKVDPVRMKPSGIDKTDPLYYDVEVPKALRISSQGEYVHWADWNPNIGYANTSHGCINVYPQHIGWFYSTFGAGDVVDVRNAGPTLGLTDGLGDWTLSWDQWVNGSALHV
jgi:lipoprotein-anchoring transpeptidase ErfK/SrfK